MAFRHVPVQVYVYGKCTNLASKVINTAFSVFPYLFIYLHVANPLTDFIYSKCKNHFIEMKKDIGMARIVEISYFARAIARSRT